MHNLNYMNTEAQSEITSAFFHLPVLSQELITGLEICPGGYYLDVTVGGGGHSELILAAAPDVQVTGIDRDGDAIAAAKVMCL